MLILITAIYSITGDPAVSSNMYHYILITLYIIYDEKKNICSNYIISRY